MGGVSGIGNSEIRKYSMRGKDRDTMPTKSKRNCQGKQKLNEIRDISIGNRAYVKASRRVVSSDAVNAQKRRKGTKYNEREG